MSSSAGQVCRQPSNVEQLEELEAAFDEPAPLSLDHAKDEDEEDELGGESDERARLVCAATHLHPLPGSSRSQSLNSSSRGSSGVLPGGYDFEQDPYLPSSSPSLLPPALTRLAGMGGGIQNDGVFTNLSAKPDPLRFHPSSPPVEFVGGNEEGSNDKGDVLPTYDSAALDSTPPYWETTVTLPGGGGGPYGGVGPDDVLVDGLPVGNLFGFAWNLLVSMSFQFIGFLLTYLLHTTHAAKNGSRAGLGITLIQYGLFTRSRVAELASGSRDQSRNNDTQSFPPTTSDPWGLFGPSTSGSDWDGSTSGSSGGSAEMPYDGISPSASEPMHLSSVANEWLSYVLIAIGWFLLLGGLVNYWRAVRWARAVRCGDNLVHAIA